jgi:hypothetical protein
MASLASAIDAVTSTWQRCLRSDRSVPKSSISEP